MGPVLRNSLIAYVDDDILNVHGKLDLVLAINQTHITWLDVVMSSSPGRYTILDEMWLCSLVTAHHGCQLMIAYPNLLPSISSTSPTLDPV
jgi:hypothetical protein